MQPVALKRCARVLAGRLPAKRLPARTRARRWLHLIFKDHYSSLRGVFYSFRASPSDMKRSSKKGMEFKLQLAALVRSKIEGGKLKLELHAFFRSFRAAPTRHGGPLIKIIIRIAIDFLRRAA